MYKKILVGLELNKMADKCLRDKIRFFLKQKDVTVILVHAIEYAVNYGMAYGLSPVIDIEKELVSQANKAMHHEGTLLKISPEQQVVKIGSAKEILLKEAAKHQSDLIVIGSHGRHGIQLLLGSTANAILHYAKCDVLAVRVSRKG